MEPPSPSCWDVWAPRLHSQFDSPWPTASVISLLDQGLQVVVVAEMSTREDGPGYQDPGFTAVVLPAGSPWQPWPQVPGLPHSSRLVKYLNPLAARRSAFSCFFICQGSLVVMLVTK